MLRAEQSGRDDTAAVQLRRRVRGAATPRATRTSPPCGPGPSPPPSPRTRPPSCPGRTSRQRNSAKRRNSRKEQVKVSHARSGKKMSGGYGGYKTGGRTGGANIPRTKTGLSGARRRAVRRLRSSAVIPLGAGAERAGAAAAAAVVADRSRKGSDTAANHLRGRSVQGAKKADSQAGQVK